MTDWYYGSTHPCTRVDGSHCITRTRCIVLALIDGIHFVLALALLHIARAAKLRRGKAIAAHGAKLPTYAEHICGSGQRHLLSLISAMNGSMGNDPNGASGSAAKSGH